jgi:hypothetical protein
MGQNYRSCDLINEAKLTQICCYASSPHGPILSNNSIKKFSIRHKFVDHKYTNSTLPPHPPTFFSLPGLLRMLSLEITAEAGTWKSQ